MTNYVQLYKSTDQNAPPLSGQAGALIKLLDAVLVDGYGFTGVSITGITRSSNTATATVSAADGLRLKTGMIITVSGAVQTDYNITATITVASTTTFTYTVANTPATPATGTIVCAATLPITSITRASAVATTTLTSANSTLVTGNYVTVSGATGGDATLYNGTFVITVASTTSFTYTMTGTPSGSATGTLVYQRAPLAWARPFAAGTNAQTYRSADSTSNQFYLQVIDNAATSGAGLEAQIYGAEVMTADQTVSSGQFPTTVQQANGLCCRKAAAANSTTRSWTLWGDDRTFYLCITTGDGNGNNCATHGMGFGYFISFKPGDAFNTFITGIAGFNSPGTTNIQTGLFGTYLLCSSAPTTNAAWYVPRTYSQIGSAALALQSSMCGAASAQQACIGVNSSGGGVLSYPNGSDSGLYCQPLFLSDAINQLRGRVPGNYGPLHVVPLQNYDTVTGVTGLSGITLTALTTGGPIGTGAAGSNAPGMMLVDTFGPWA